MKFKIIPNEQTPKVQEDAIHNIFKDKVVLEKFLSFASRQKNCAGLAANQVSLDGKRILETFFAIKDGHFWDLVIDPEIHNLKGKAEMKEEGCLSWLGKTILAWRYPEIDVSYTNLKGELIKKTITGFPAQVWQHEYDHLNGIVENYR